MADLTVKDVLASVEHSNKIKVAIVFTSRLPTACLAYTYNVPTGDIELMILPAGYGLESIEILRDNKKIPMYVAGNYGKELVEYPPTMNDRCIPDWVSLLRDPKNVESSYAFENTRGDYNVFAITAWDNVGVFTNAEIGGFFGGPPKILDTWNRMEVFFRNNIPRMLSDGYAKIVHNIVDSVPNSAQQKLHAEYSDYFVNVVLLPNPRVGTAGIVDRVRIALRGLLYQGRSGESIKFLETLKSLNGLWRSAPNRNDTTVSPLDRNMWLAFAVITLSPHYVEVLGFPPTVRSGGRCSRLYDGMTHVLSEFSNALGDSNMRKFYSEADSGSAMTLDEAISVAESPHSQAVDNVAKFLLSIV